MWEVVPASFTFGLTDVTRSFLATLLSRSEYKASERRRPVCQVFAAPPPIGLLRACTGARVCQLRRGCRSRSHTPDWLSGTWGP